MAKKRYYQGKMDRKHESMGMKKYEEKKNGGSKDMRSMSYDDSLFGFPAKSLVAQYPQVRVFNQYSMAGQDDIAGTDYEIDANVMGLNENKARSRF